jgi:hypothetical protein
VEEPREAISEENKQIKRLFNELLNMRQGR